MYELDRHCAFASSCGDALDRAGPHVPSGEHAGPAGLQEVWVPPCGSVWGLRQVGTGPHKALIVSLDLRWKPIGARHGSDEAEHGGGLHGSLLAGPVV